MQQQEANALPLQGEYDVLVVGGGPAGIGASLAAARKGMKTLIVEQFNCLGGVAGAGGHGHISAYNEGGSSRRIVGGIAHELADRLVQEGVGSRNPHAVDFEVEGLKYLLEGMMQEAGVALLYHTFFCEAILEGTTIRGAVIQNKSGRQRVQASQIIDCTGDGDVAFSAGCPYEVGRASDSKCQPVTLMFTIGGVDWKRVEAFRQQHVKQFPGDGFKLNHVYARAIEAGDMEPFQTGNMGWWWTPTRPDQVGVNFTHIIHIDSTRAEDLTRATMEGRRQAHATVQIYRKLIPGMEDCYMVSTPNTVGLRESRRIMGEVVVTEEDIKSQHIFQDTIALGSFFVDIHCIDGPGMDPTVWQPPKTFRYGIPYRALVPKDAENLLVAGRCISCTHIALGSLRVMVPCIAEGEAAGYAAALAVQQKTSPRSIDVHEIRELIRANGGILDEEDIARANG